MQTIRKGSGRLPGVGSGSQSGGGQEDCQEFVQADNQERRKESQSEGKDRQTFRKGGKLDSQRGGQADNLERNAGQFKKRRKLP